MGSSRNGFGREVSRKEVRRILGQVSVGVGAILLAAVDDWNYQTARHPARLRTELDVLGRGSTIAFYTAAGTKTWLETDGRHPPRHLVVGQPTWPAVSSWSKTFMKIHHRELQPANPTQEAFCAQDTEALDIPGNPLLCELTWEYDMTQTFVRHIWISAPSVEWAPIEVPKWKVQAQLASWRKREVPWLPGTHVASDLAEVITARPERAGLRTGITVKETGSQSVGEAG